MQKIRIITDSASDITRQTPGLTVLPMTVRFGDCEYQDGVTIDHRTFYEKLIESDTLPTTSLVSPAAFAAAYREALSAGEQVVAVTVSGELSGTYQSAVLAAADYPGQVYVVDSRSAAIGQQILVEYALTLVQQGCGAAEITAILTRERENIHLIALLDTLEYLKKGGRVPPSVAFVGGILSIKPVITLQDGTVAMLGTARGSRNGNNFLIREIQRTQGVDFSRPLRLGYTGLDDTLLQKYIQDSRTLWDGHEEALQISTIGATIGTHIGPGAIAVAFFSL